MSVSPDTTQQIVTGVRVNLRRPGDIKLPNEDIQEKINDLCRQYIQEESLQIRDRRTVVAPLTITVPEDNTVADFEITDFAVPDFEVQRLEVANATGPTFIWQEADVVPFEAWARHYTQNHVVASFYGSSDTSTPAKVKLSLLDSEVPRFQFRVSYRLPLLTIVQLGDKPPIPSAHMPMLKLHAAILCMPLVKDDSLEWVAWMARTLPLYESQLTALRSNWKDYLDSSVEPQVQSIRRSDRAEYARRRPVRPFIPSQ